MKTRHLISTAALAATLLGGCILGGSGDERTAGQPTPTDTDTGKTSVKSPAAIKAGYYRGDFTSNVPGTSFEPELVLREDGTFRYIAIDSNAVLFMYEGNWLSRNDSMFNTLQRMTSPDFFSFFTAWDSVPNDTLFIRNVTGDGFERMEYLPFANNGQGKIAWVPYRRTTYPQLARGKFELRQIFNDTTFTVLFDLGDSSHFTLETALDDEKQQRHVASWYQEGSFLFTHHYTFYEPDSNQQMVAVDSTEGAQAYRVKDITSQSFKAWNGVNWDEFRRLQ